jgi:hypothetical protein
MHLLRQKTGNRFIKIILAVPSTSHSTCTAAWLGFDTSWSIEQRNVRMTNDADGVPFVEQKEDHIFSRQCTSKSSDSNIGIIGYTDQI